MSLISNAVSLETPITSHWEFNSVVSNAVIATRPLSYFDWFHIYFRALLASPLHGSETGEIQRNSDRNRFYSGAKENESRDARRSGINLSPRGLSNTFTFIFSVPINLRWFLSISWENYLDRYIASRSPRNINSHSSSLCRHSDAKCLMVD